MFRMYDTDKNGYLDQVHFSSSNEHSSETDDDNSEHSEHSGETDDDNNEHSEWWNWWW